MGILVVVAELPRELVWHRAASVPVSHFGEDRMLGLERITL